MKYYYINILLILVFILTTISCKDNHKKESENIEVIDMTPRKQDGDPIRTHRDAEGNIWSDYNIFAPRENETRDAYERRTNTGKYAPPQSQYDKGYEDGYNDAVNELGD